MKRRRRKLPAAEVEDLATSDVEDEEGPETATDEVSAVAAKIAQAHAAVSAAEAE